WARRMCIRDRDKVAALANCILFEDDVLLVLNKPSGTAVHGGSGLSFGVIEGLRALRPEARFLELVHRLDRDTSGILLVAKKRSALRALHEQLRLKQMQKDYLALVRGNWQSHMKVIQAPLLKNILQSGERVVKVSSEGKPSETRFKVEERFDNATLVKASPVTGRTHQIRVHTLYAGHPIAFDDRYGDKQFDSQLAGTGLNRLFLHASALKFTHPKTGEEMRLQAPLDNQLNHCLKILRSRKAEK
ncbi:23S rRNA pseudouridine(955/2504/2580) synthase RluC, partial [Providencia rettgeri]